MSKIQGLVFWVEGLIVPHIEEQLFHTLGIQGQYLDEHKLIQLRKFEADFYRGELTSAEYMQVALGVLNHQDDSEASWQALKTKVKFNTGMIDLLNTLGQSYQLIWVSCLPHDILQVVHEGWIEETCTEIRLISQPCPSLVMLRLALEREFLFMLDQVLLIDDRSLRCFDAILLGYNVNIFVDVQRLRRDLELWGLLRA